MFMFSAERAGALEREVFGFDDGWHPAELRVNAAHPRELAFCCCLQITGTPDDPLFVVDVAHANLSSADDSRGYRQSYACPNAAYLTDWTSEPDLAVRKRLSPRFCARGGLHHSGRDR
jgi:hypothetical protein